MAATTQATETALRIPRYVPAVFRRLLRELRIARRSEAREVEMLEGCGPATPEADRWNDLIYNQHYDAELKLARAVMNLGPMSSREIAHGTDFFKPRAVIIDGKLLVAYHAPEADPANDPAERVPAIRLLYLLELDLATDVVDLDALAG